MLVSMNWVQDFVDLKGLDLESLIQRFTLSTAEVEEVFHKGETTRGIVVAKILTVQNHPKSKKLHLLTVDKGGEAVNCVCGAPNVREAMHVAFAPAGAAVGGMDIARAFIAGYESNGMCCSERELGLSDDHEGILDLDSAGIPVDLDKYLGAPVEQFVELYDTIFEVDNKSITNRPDLWGIYGIAREFAALTGRPLQPVPQADLAQYDHLPAVDVKIDHKACYCYSGLKVENISAKNSPLAVRTRLFGCGMRGINLLADLTNYLMLELGQPMHAFDLRRVSSICVKNFSEPFSFQTLDGNERAIDANTLMICTGEGKPVAVAGIMGGYDSEIKDDTSALLLESATFDPVSIRKSSSRLGLRTDASARYEKALDPLLTTPAVGRFLQLLRQSDGGVRVISRLSQAKTFAYPEININLKQSYIDRYTGNPLEKTRIIGILQSLGFGVKPTDEGYLVQVPSFRATKDVTIAADLIEEITRIYGYDNFEMQSTRSLLAPVRPARRKTDRTNILDLLVQRCGLHEVHSYLWADRAKYKALNLEIPSNVRLLNSVNPNHETLRNCMVPTLLSFIAENKGFREEFGIFEMGRVILGLSDAGQCNERRALGIALYSKEADEEALFFRLRNTLDELIFLLRHSHPEFPKTSPPHAWAHPVNCFTVAFQGTTLGQLAALHPRTRQAIDKKAAIVVAELDLDALADMEIAPVCYSEPSKFPGIAVDLSFVLGPGQVYQDIAQAAQALACPWLQTVSVADTFAMEQHVSVTIRLEFADHTRTLTHTELQPYVDRLMTALRAKGIDLKE
jgi:phenylalanyl-tRNA synthetase beta chain